MGGPGLLLFLALMIWFFLAIAAGVLAVGINRSFFGWFVLGLIFPIAVLFVAIAPEKKSMAIGAEQPRSDHQSVFDGEPTLTNDAYKIYLVNRYNITKNEVLGRFIINDKLFPTVEAALNHAEKLDAGTIVTNEGTISGVRKKRRKFRYKEFKNGTIELEITPGTPSGLVQFANLADAEKYIEAKY